jgi:polyisoprenoid-binding protein YceI/predicted TIM-barrel fold metal-dependent hydrolase
MFQDGHMGGSCAQCHTTSTVPRYEFDAALSKVEFTIHAYGFELAGVFKTVSGGFLFDAAEPESGSVIATVETASVDAGSDALNSLIRSDRFLSAAEHPVMSFRSESLEAAGLNKLRITGTLSVLGIERSLRLDVIQIGTGMNPLTGRQTAGFVARGTLKRSDFGLNLGLPAIGDEVELTIYAAGTRLPIKVDSASNGEFMPRPLTNEQIRANELAQRRVDESSRRTGLSRRRFLKSSMGSACTLLAFNEAHAQAGHAGGYFDIPADAAHDLQLAQAAVQGNEFIFDIQNHVVDPTAGWRSTPNGQRWNFVLANNFPQAQKCTPGSLECYSSRQFVQDVFLDSDTTMSVVSALWGPPDGNPTPIEYANEVREVVEMLGEGRRALLHGGVMPNLPGALDYMDMLAGEFDIAAWKLYPQWGEGGVGYFVDGDTAVPFIEKARSLGIKTVCAHRGLPLPFCAYEYSSPRDMGAAAAKYPDMTFICYHSGFEPGKAEGPYDPSVDQGVNRLIKSHQEHGFKPNEGNLYAELGSLWRGVMSAPDQAAHTIGKLLKYFGEDRICWGSDTIWYGSPQDQIQAFRTFQIGEEFRERFGYPALTPEARTKIFGLNAARVYNVDRSEIERSARRDTVGTLKANYSNDPNPTFETYGPKTRREFLQLLTLNDGVPG